MPAFCRPCLLRAAPIDPEEPNQSDRYAGGHSRSCSSKSGQAEQRARSGFLGQACLSCKEAERAQPRLTNVQTICHVAGVLVSLCKASGSRQGGQSCLLLRALRWPDTVSFTSPSVVNAHSLQAVVSAAVQVALQGGLTPYMVHNGYPASHERILWGCHGCTLTSSLPEEVCGVVRQGWVLGGAH